VPFFERGVQAPNTCILCGYVFDFHGEQGECADPRTRRVLKDEELRPVPRVVREVRVNRALREQGMSSEDARRVQVLVFATLAAQGLDVHGGHVSLDQAPRCRGCVHCREDHVALRQALACPTCGHEGCPNARLPEVVA